MDDAVPYGYVMYNYSIIKGIDGLFIPLLAPGPLNVIINVPVDKRSSFKFLF